MSGFPSIAGGGSPGVELSHVVENTGADLAKVTSAVNSLNVSSITQLSPLGQLTSTLQQLQQADPTKYRQVVQQIAADLQTDAETARSEGENSMAVRLNQLAGAYTTAAESGELPNLPDLSALEAL